MDPIFKFCRDFNFFNSKSPAKSLKLSSPISINSNDAQFNMWNDFDLSSPELLFCLVNERIPIFKLFSFDKSLMLNIFTNAKLLLPISNDSSSVNLLISNISQFTSLHVHGSSTMEVIVDSIERNESTLCTVGNNEELTSMSKRMQRKTVDFVGYDVCKRRWIPNVFAIWNIYIKSTFRFS